MRDAQVTAPQDPGQARLDYAWEWFKYHAGQRVSMFNYFLIITGIFANAYAGLLKDGSRDLIVHGGRALGIIGALTAIGFVMLDVRNKSLVDRGSSVLEEIEKGALFGGETPRLAGGSVPGLIRSHTFWIRGIEIVVAIVFLLLAAAARIIGDMPE